MFKRLVGCIREYKKPTILTLIFIVGEAVIETLIPFITARLVNEIKAGAGVAEIVRVGLVLVAMAFASLACGGIAAHTCARASAGFARNVRQVFTTRCRIFPLKTLINMLLRLSPG